MSERPDYEAALRHPDAARPRAPQARRDAEPTPFHPAPVTSSDEYEAALRSLPEAHSLVLRLSDAGTADDVICDYLRIEPEALPALLDVARRKLRSALSKPSSSPD